MYVLHARVCVCVCACKCARVSVCVCVWERSRRHYTDLLSSTGGPTGWARIPLTFARIPRPMTPGHAIKLILQNIVSRAAPVSKSEPRRRNASGVEKMNRQSKKKMNQRSENERFKLAKL